MAEKEEDDLEIDPDSVTPEEDLMVTFFSGLRIFTLNNAAQTTVLGVTMSETDDSFLVGLPSRLTEPAREEKDGKLTVTGPPVIIPVSAVPYLRVFKTSILGMSHMYGIFKEKYVEYILTEGKKLYPEVLEYIDEEEDSAQQASEQDDSTEVQDDVLDISLSNDAGKSGEVVGMSDRELKEYLEKNYNMGDLLSGSGKKH